MSFANFALTPCRSNGEFEKVMFEPGVTLFSSFLLQPSIDKIIDKHLKKSSEEELTSKGLVDFSQFFSIKYEKYNKLPRTLL